MTLPKPVLFHVLHLLPVVVVLYLSQTFRERDAEFSFAERADEVGHDSSVEIGHGLLVKFLVEDVQERAELNFCVWLSHEGPPEINRHEFHIPLGCVGVYVPEVPQVQLAMRQLVLLQGLHEFENTKCKLSELLFGFQGVKPITDNTHNIFHNDDVYQVAFCVRGYIGPIRERFLSNSGLHGFRGRPVVLEYSVFIVLSKGIH